MIITSAKVALYYSLAFTLIALFIFGYVKGRMIGSPNPLSSALSMMLLGGMAAGCAYAIASSTNSKKLKHF
jgi:VIT1/CCC1 family predicted Fe2+/Mn2+ transporter